jgi:hypothetical protein
LAFNENWANSTRPHPSSAATDLSIHWNFGYSF